MTTNPILIHLAAGDGLEETPSGMMSSEWLDAVWDRCVDIWFARNQNFPNNFRRSQFALLATMQDVGPKEAAKRLTGEGE